jgi:hypothetical protein
MTEQELEHLRILARPINTPLTVVVSMHDLMKVLSFLYDEHARLMPYAVQDSHDRMIEAAYAVAHARDAMLSHAGAPDDSPPH